MTYSVLKVPLNPNQPTISCDLHARSRLLFASCDCVMYGMHIHLSIPSTLCDDCRKTLHNVGLIILISYYEMHTDETYLVSYSRQKHSSPHEH